MQEQLDSQLSTEVSLKADREYLAEERKQIPEDIQKANDELAFDLEQMGRIKEDPNRIRSRFQTKVRKLREDFREDMRKVRDKYNKNERKRREDFLDEARKAREKFKRGKPDREASKEFYDEQSLQRKDFFAEQREKRSEFEEEMRARSKEFHESMRERVRQFNDQLRIYTQRYREQKRCEKTGECGDSASSGPQSQPQRRYDLREFQEMNQVPGVRLTPKKSGN